MSNKLEVPSIEKRQGDNFLKDKNYHEALHHYKSAIVALKIVFDDEELNLANDEEKATALINEVGIPSHLNSALCYLNLEDFVNVVFYCTKVLELDQDNVKALYRRCKANIKLEKV